MDNQNKEEIIEVKETTRKKKITKKIVKILIILSIAFVFIFTAPFIYFVGVVVFNMLQIPSKPNIEHGEFEFELVYEYKGEQATIKDTIICDYDGYSFSLDGGNSRDWVCDFKNNDEYGFYYIDEENEPSLYIMVPTAPGYYMGDKDYTKEDAHPYIYYEDTDTGTYYQEKEKIDVVDIKIISWNPSEPLKDNFK